MRLFALENVYTFILRTFLLIQQPSFEAFEILRLWRLNTEFLRERLENIYTLCFQLTLFEQQNMFENEKSEFFFFV